LVCGADCGNLPAPRYIYSGFTFVPEEVRYMELGFRMIASWSWHRLRVTFFTAHCGDMSRAVPDGRRPYPRTLRAHLNKLIDPVESHTKCPGRSYLASRWRRR
jgi:hypothetical protein